MERRNAWLETHPVELAWAADLDRRIQARTDQLGVDAVRHQPDHLSQIIGPLPSNASRQGHWRQLASYYEAYRERWHIHPDQLLGHTPSRGVQARHWNNLSEATAIYQRHLAQHQTPTALEQHRYYQHEQTQHRGIDRGRSL
jgi:hypothetical protein